MNNTLRVLMIASQQDIHSVRPLDWLLEKGCRVLFSSDFNPYPQGKEGYTFAPFPDDRGARILPWLFGERIGGWLFIWIARSRLRLLYRRFCPDVVHVHWVGERAHLCVQAGVHPLVLTVWGSDINKHFLPNTDDVSRRRVGETLSGADLIIIDAADIRKKCVELAAKEVPIELMTLGVNTERFRPGFAEAASEWRRRLAISSDATVLLSIRGWSPLYRHEGILEAFAQALPRLNREAVLVFKILKRLSVDRAVYEKTMRDLAEKLGVAKQVRWMKSVPIDRLPEVYSFADAVLNYPSMDAFPVTFLEAAACERPVISCRLPAYAGTFVQEYFRMVSPDDLLGLSDAMVEFVNGNRIESRARLAELRNLICRDYDERIVADRLVEVYRKLASKYSKSGRTSA